MKLRYFFGFALLYLVLVGAYAFYIAADYSYTLTNTLFFEFHLTLPVALWLCLPTILLFIIALLFMSFAALVQKFKNMALRRDIDKIFTQIQEQMLGNPIRNRVFSNPDLHLLSKSLQRFYLLPNTNTPNVNHEKIDATFDIFKDILNGNNDSKIRLNQSHPFYNLNIRNSIQDDASKALNILKQDLNASIVEKDTYIQTNRQAVYNKAWKVLLSGGPKTLQKALQLTQNHLTYATLFQLMQTCAKGGIDIQKEVLISACKSVKLNEKEYLGLAIAVCELLQQNNINFWLQVFESLSKEVEASVFAYFYILLEVGKTDEAMDLKQQYPKDDFLTISAFSALKEKGYPLLVFFDPILYRTRKLEKSQPTTPNAMQLDYKNH